MDALKDIFTAYSQRIRSPIIGSVILAFIAVNWQSVFYVIFADKGVLSRFEYWDMYTDFWTVLMWPVLIGVTFAVLSPFISLVGAWLAKWPTEQVRLIAVRSADRVEKEKQRLAGELVDKTIDTTVEQQERLQTIEDDSVREALQKQIDEINSKSYLQLSGDAAEKNSNEREAIDLRSQILELRLKLEERQKGRGFTLSSGPDTTHPHDKPIVNQIRLLEQRLLKIQRDLSSGNSK